MSRYGGRGAYTDQVRDAVFALRREDGNVYPADVVEAARDPKSILHQFFEWDDATAAQQFRLDQARDLIHSLTYIVETTHKEIQYVVAPAFVYESHSSGRSGYRPLGTLREDDGSIARTLDWELSKWAACLSRSIAVIRGSAGGDGRMARLLGEVLCELSDVERFVNDIRAARETLANPPHGRGTSST